MNKEQLQQSQEAIDYIALLISQERGRLALISDNDARLIVSNLATMARFSESTSDFIDYAIQCLEAGDEQ